MRNSDNLLNLRHKKCFLVHFKGNINFIPQTNDIRQYGIMATNFRRISFYFHQNNFIYNLLLILLDNLYL